MELRDRIAVVTGGASGIGEGLALRFKAEGARHVVVADRDEAGAKAVAGRIGGTGVGIDVADEGAIEELVAETERSQGPIDLFVSNAGYVTVGGVEAPTEDLQRMWEVHVLAHLHAARAVLPGMIERGEGYLLNTASAAGLLTQLGSLHYSVTKHAAIALAEWLAVTHGPQGIRVSVLCPQAVETKIGANSPSKELRQQNDVGVASQDGVLQADEVAGCVIEAVAEERFWVLPHPEVAVYAKRKAGDVDRWIGGMMRFQDRLFEGREKPGDWLVRGR
ncbi:MAG: short-chain dehydrogenase [Deltaproteobacteria bacterium]|jgi:NAD(P)-dependent dehydrogenase (short-subunit alcohol dehydrogenase family)|nr:short-chain dehydrogenase [Deltaproteobacteria bacterium]